MIRSTGSRTKVNRYSNALLGTAVIVLNLTTHWASLEMNGRFIKAVPQRLVAYQSDQINYLKSLTKMSWELV